MFLKKRAGDITYRYHAFGLIKITASNEFRAGFVGGVHKMFAERDTHRIEWLYDNSAYKGEIFCGVPELGFSANIDRSDEVLSLVQEAILAFGLFGISLEFDNPLNRS